MGKKNEWKIYCYKCEAVTFLSWAWSAMSQKGREREEQEDGNALQGYLSEQLPHPELSPTVTRASGAQEDTQVQPLPSPSPTATALKCQTGHTCLVLSASAPGHSVQKSFSDPFLNLLILPVSANPFSSKLQNFTACHVETFLPSPVLNPYLMLGWWFCIHFSHHLNNFFLSFLKVCPNPVHSLSKKRVTDCVVCVLMVT